MHRTSGSLVWACALGCPLLLAAVPAAGQVELRPAVVSGQAAPDTGGRPFYFLDTPAINDAGEIAFNAWLPHTPENPRNPTGIWSGTPGALRLNALQGTLSTAPNQLPYSGFGTTVGLTDGGDVLFSAAFPPQENYQNPGGFFVARVGDPAAPRVIAASQMEAPEARSKQFFDYIADFPRRVSPTGHVTFTARLGGKEIEERVNDTGVWLAAPGTGERRLVARAGWQAPGAPKGQVFAEGVHASGVAFHPPAVDRDGNVAFVAHVKGEDVDDFNERGLWYSDKTGNLSLVARHGAPLSPGSGVFYQDIGYEPTVANGRLAFLSEMYGPPPRDDGDLSAGAAAPSDSERFTAIVTGRPEALKIVAATLTRPAGADFRFDDLSEPVLNARGDAVFMASLAFDGKPEPVNTVWAASASGRRMLVSEGDEAAGAGAGVVFKELSRPSVNAAGDYVFFADLEGPGVGEANNRGIFAGRIGDLADADGADPGLTLVAREGQVIDLGDGVARTVQSLEMLTGSNGGEDGLPSGFNDAGQLAFVARFTDGSNAILIAAVPEPAAAGVLLGLATLVLAGRRRGAWASCSGGTSSRNRP